MKYHGTIPNDQPDAQHASNSKNPARDKMPIVSARDIKIRVPNRKPANDTPATSAKGRSPKIIAHPQTVSKELKPYTEETDFLTAALWWFTFGFKIIPLVPNTKKPTVKWDPWLENLSPRKITSYWEKHPDHELGFILGDDIIVFDADSPMAIAALYDIEEAFDLTPNLIVSTTKGEYHYFSLSSATFAKSDSHSTEKHPERIDVKTGRALVILPPSTGKEVMDND